MLHTLGSRQCLRSALRYAHVSSETRLLLGPYRTHYIHEIRHSAPGTKVRVCGRISYVRTLGHINFVVLTNNDESVQAVWKRDYSNSSNSDLESRIRALVANSFCSLEGTVTDRRDIAFENVIVLSQPDSSVSRWPIQPDTCEDSRLRLRFLDLREPDLHRRLKLRSRVAHAIHCLLQSLQFTEVETPILTASSPEGAREFLVPTRKPGHYFALSQSPQQYKQLLMAAGFERYYQFARCFRDEDGRRDRQSEFTQIDIEMAFVTSNEIMHLTETLMRNLSISFPELELYFPDNAPEHYSYDYVVCNYGSDKPDLRTKQMTLHDISGWVVMLCRQVHESPLELDLGNVFACPLTNNSTINSGIPKHAIEFCVKQLHAEPGDCIIASTDRHSLGTARNKLIPWLQKRNLLQFEQQCSWLWVTGFPLFERGPGSKLQSCHHPFTSPVDIQKLFDAQHSTDALLSLKAQSYDLVVNGIELGGGSIRIQDYNVQKLVLSLLNSGENSGSFQALLSALRHGCPPHGGIAIGFDRLISEFPCADESLRNAIAFPKSSNGRDLMMSAPALLNDNAQLINNGIQNPFCNHS